MALFTNSILFDGVAFSVAIIVGFATFVKWTYNYWTRKGVYTRPASFPYGNAQDLAKLKMNLGEHFRDLYKEIKTKGLRHGGSYFFFQKFYVPTDLEIVKRIMQNDFSHFVNRGSYVNEIDDPLSGILFNLEDERWKNMRAKLTSAFTSGKMKMMFNILEDCSKSLNQMMLNASKSDNPLDIKNILQCFTMDVISSCAFGLETNTMKNPDTEFALRAKLILEPNFKNAIRRMLTLFFNHDVLRFFGMKLFNEDSTDFFMDVIKKTVEYRENNNIYRNDFMHLLLQLKNRGNVYNDDKLTDDSGKEGLTFNEMAAQVFVFFIAGYETSSTAMTFALYELAQRPDLQEKALEEINTVLGKHGKITYEAIKEMTYLEQILNESLRKYPPLPVLIRKCNKNYTIPDSDVVIEKGDSVAISTLGIQHDPEYYPNPEVFDPDRFNEENKAKRPAYAWIPFGEGPRVCIGLRFGVMQAKVGLMTILKDYIVSLNKNTQIPLKFDPKNFILLADGGVWINVEKRQ